MEEKIKEIVAQYLRTTPAEIRLDTVIDRSALKGSIIVHRFYANLASVGIAVSDYQSIRNFGELLARLNGEPATTRLEESNSVSNTSMPPDGSSIGIDIEDVSNIPVAIDYREDPFFKQSFSSREISYCITQTNARESFAGLFAAKEAIVKSDNRFKMRPFNEIEIDHDGSGKPTHKGFSLSISHVGVFAIAVAVHNSVTNQISVDSVDHKISNAEQTIRELQRKVRLYGRMILFAFAVLTVVVCFEVFG